jgi:ABC-type phosphate/phosphonate transport system substrate-binding protein
MKVYYSDSSTLTPFEKTIATLLEKLPLTGYVFAGYSYPIPDHDHNNANAVPGGFLLVYHPGVICCLEAKSIEVTEAKNLIWTGSATSSWQVNDHSFPEHPYKTLTRFSFRVQERLDQNHGTSIIISSALVVPDELIIQIKDVSIDQINTKGYSLCHLSQLASALAEISPTERQCSVFEEVGIQAIAENLVGFPVQELPIAIPPKRVSEEKKLDIQEAEKEIQLAQSTSNPIISESAPTHFRIPLLISGTILILTGSILGGYLFSYLTQNHNPNLTPLTSSKIQSEFKDLRQESLEIGLLTDPSDYAQLSEYLEKEWRTIQGFHLRIALQGGSSIDYQTVRNHIANKDWDLIFAYSPMNSLAAKDNGYSWAARMFPEFPPFYQSVLFVREDSPIQGISDIQSSTRVALGSFGSASSFYMPAYSLYGKSFVLSLGNRTEHIKAQVKAGQVDLGAAAISSIDKDPDFRIIEVSRDIPGSGVYLSPRLSVEDQQVLRQLLLAAPNSIKKLANYGVGEEPNYEEFRQISLRAEEVISCVNFQENPVRFFCDSSPRSTPLTKVTPPESILGQIKGWRLISQETVQFTLQGDDNQLYRIEIPLTILSGVVNCTSPALCNQKLVKISGVLPGSDPLLLPITDPTQMQVLSQE